MNSRERILTILEGGKADRTPADIWYTDEIRDQLLQHFGYEREDELFDSLGVDKIVRIEAPYLKSVPERTVWGNRIKRVYTDTGALYLENGDYPLAGSEEQSDLTIYSWPKVEDFDFRSFRLRCEENGRWVRMLSFISLFENYCNLKPLDEALMDLYLRPGYALALLNRMKELQLAYIEAAFAEAGELIDMVYLSDDMGMQDRLLMSLDTWESFFAEPYQEIIDLAHRLGGRVMYHSDGAAFPVLHRMIEMGVDVINPIQHRCQGMDREHLIDELGDRVIFHGGVENQQILPFGSPEEVKEEVRENIRLLGRYGRYICAPCHNLQSGTPIKNIIALYEAVKEEG